MIHLANIDLPTIVEIFLLLALFVAVAFELLRKNWQAVIILAIVIVAVVIVFGLLF